MLNMHRVSEKNSQNCFYHDLVKFLLTLIIFVTEMAKTMKLCKGQLFFTSHNLCQRTTVSNTTAPNRGITLSCCIK